MSKLELLLEECLKEVTLKEKNKAVVLYEIEIGLILTPAQMESARFAAWQRKLKRKGTVTGGSI